MQTIFPLLLLEPSIAALLQAQFCSVVAFGKLTVSFGMLCIFVASAILLSLLIVLTALRVQLKKRMAETEKKYRAIAEKTHDAIYIYQGDRLLFVNDWLSKVTGYSKEELFSMDIWDLIHPDDKERLIEIAKRRASGLEVPDKYTAKTITKDGRIAYCEFANTIITYNGKYAVLGAVRDITDRIEAEKKIKDSEQKLRLLLQNLPDFILTIDRNGKILSLNRTLIANSVDELIGKNIYDFIAETDKSKSSNAIEKVFATGESNVYESIGIAKDGTYSAYYENRVIPIFDADKVQSAIIIARDVTREKQMREKSAKQKRNLEVINRIITSGAKTSNLADFLKETLDAIVDSLDFDMGGIYILDETGEVGSLEYSTGLDNSTIEALKYIRADEHPFSKILSRGSSIFESDYEKVYPKHSKFGIKSIAGVPLLSQTRRVGSLEVATKVRREFTDDEKELLNSIGWEIGAIITRVKAEEKLAESKKNLQVLFDSIDDFIIILDFDGNILEFNPALTTRLGYKKEELLSANYKKIILSPEQYKQADNFFRQLLQKTETEAGVNITQLVFSTKYGAEIPLEINASVGKWKEQDVIFVICRDITERQEAHNEILKREEKYRNLFENSLVGMFRASLDDGVIIDANATLRKMFDLDVQAKCSLGDMCLTFEEREDLIKKIIEEKYVENIELELQKADGTKFWVSFSAKYYPDEGLFEGVMIDITEKRKYEAEMLKATKLESLGILAGGIAHDFNNSLMAILGNATLGKIYADKQSELYQILSEIEKASYQARDLTSQLLTFSKGGAPVKKLTSVNDLLRDTVKFALRGSNTKYQIEIDEQLLNIEVDLAQMSQVLNNLIINADQAMPEGGLLTLRAKNFDNTSNQLKFLKQRQYVKLIISDTGVGIAEENLNKIFDPYFTTKKTGSGLGLATTYSIIKKHDGHICVESELGKGTTFYIYLPASSEKIEHREKSKAGPAKGTGKILIMDDEEVIRKVLSRLLETLGYRSITAQNGEEAIALYIDAYNHGEKFDAVIVDLTVPGAMGGQETIKKLKNFDPNVKAIVSSGYYNIPILADYKAFGFVGVLLKPYDINELAETLKKVLT